jgi:Flp pilus assembly pilin Flp
VSHLRVRMALLKGPVDDESGQALVEYALVLSLVSIAAVVALAAIGGSLQTMISNVLQAFPG